MSEAGQSSQWLFAKNDSGAEAIEMTGAEAIDRCELGTAFSTSRGAKTSSEHRGHVDFLETQVRQSYHRVLGKL